MTLRSFLTASLTAGVLIWGAAAEAQHGAGFIGPDGCAVNELREGAWGSIYREVQGRAVARWEAAAAQLYGAAFADASASARQFRHTVCSEGRDSIAGAVWCEIIARPCGPNAASGTGGPIQWERHR